MAKRTGLKIIKKVNETKVKKLEDFFQQPKPEVFKLKINGKEY